MMYGIKYGFNEEWYFQENNYNRGGTEHIYARRWFMVTEPDEFK
jgi:hypothetical protein